MLLKRKVRLSDIAQECNVSTTLVSAIINGKPGNVRYSDETRRKVRETAEKLNYRPNLLARALITRNIPLVALSIHHLPPVFGDINYYAYDVVLNGSLELYGNDRHSVLLPYRDHIEQIEKLRHLIGDGLIGGIITNYLAGEADGLVDYLRSSGIPHILLGPPFRDDVHFVHREGHVLYQKISQYCERVGLEQFLQVALDREGNLGFRDSEGRGIEDVNSVDIHDPTLLLVATGDRSTHVLLHEGGVDKKNILTLEDSRIPVYSRPALIKQSSQSRVMALAVKLICEWMTEGEMPHPQGHAVEDLEEEHTLIESRE